MSVSFIRYHNLTHWTCSFLQSADATKSQFLRSKRFWIKCTSVATTKTNRTDPSQYYIIYIFGQWKRSWENGGNGLEEWAKENNGRRAAVNRRRNYTTYWSYHAHAYTYKQKPLLVYCPRPPKEKQAHFNLLTSVTRPHHPRRVWKDLGKNIFQPPTHHLLSTLQKESCRLYGSKHSKRINGNTGRNNERS